MTAEEDKERPWVAVPGGVWDEYPIGEMPQHCGKTVLPASTVEAISQAKGETSCADNQAREAVAHELGGNLDTADRILSCLREMGWRRVWMVDLDEQLLTVTAERDALRAQNQALVEVAVAPSILRKALTEIKSHGRKWSPIYKIADEALTITAALSAAYGPVAAKTLAYGETQSGNGNDAVLAVQWKGTDLCADFTCECGGSRHIDSTFVYGIQCFCGIAYEVSNTVQLSKVEFPVELTYYVSESNDG